MTLCCRRSESIERIRDQVDVDVNVDVEGDYIIIEVGSFRGSRSRLFLPFHLSISLFFLISEGGRGGCLEQIVRREVGGGSDSGSGSSGGGGSRGGTYGGGKHLVD